MIYLILVILGFFLLVKGSDYLVDGASSIAKRLHIPEIVIGMTIVAIGTSLPELVVSTTAALAAHSDIAIGNIIGSNITNLLFILGSCSLLKTLKFHKETVYYENLFMLISGILLFILGISSKIENMNFIGRGEGLFLLGLCFLFLLYNLCISLKNNSNNDEESVKKNIIFSIFKIIIGIIALKIGADIVIDNITYFAKMIGVSEKVISLTLVAFSTSLPELMTSISATKKGDIDIAIGNIIGSNILNILLIIGLTAFICPITYSITYNKDMIWLIISSLIFVIYPFIGKKNSMTPLKGLIFLIIYFWYVLTLLV